MNAQTLTCTSNKLKVTDTSRKATGQCLEINYAFQYDPEVSADLHSIIQFPLENRPLVHLHMSLPSLGAAGIWTPHSGSNKNIQGDWMHLHTTNLSHSAPVVCFFSYNDENRITFAVSEVNRDVHMLAGVREETGEIVIDTIVYLCEPVETYQISFLISQEDQPFYSALSQVSCWWDSILSEQPLTPPAEATLPMYSTWYSYHQNVSDENLSREYALAASMGMKAVIIDDGWQTSDNHRGYGFCGDWEAEKSKFPDFRKHVDLIHNYGMKCLIWYSVPFVGEFSKQWEVFQDKLLHRDHILHTGVLDPRYPQVRSYLISVYEKALDDWNLDGFKLDFIDSFRHYPDTPESNGEMDFVEIQDAVYKLMLDISKHLRAKKTDLLIEFRQSYIGPQMRRFGNIFRVADCPLSPSTNRTGIADLKLISGSTAVHTDMLMWHKDEKPEDVAIQLVNSIFSTLQISVSLPDLSPEQKAVLEYYLNFSVSYRAVLQNGTFTARAPLAMYPVLQAEKDHVSITAFYVPGQVLSYSDPDTVNTRWYLNGTRSEQLFLETRSETSLKIESYDCCGNRIRTENMVCPAGVHMLPVTPGGSVKVCTAS